MLLLYSRANIFAREGLRFPRASREIGARLSDVYFSRNTHKGHEPRFPRKMDLILFRAAARNWGEAAGVSSYQCGMYFVPPVP